MAHRPLVMLLAGALFLGVLGDIPEASAHPAPYPHRHYYRRAPKQPTYRRTPRRRAEEPERRSYFYFAIGALGNTGLNADTQLSRSVTTGGGFNLSLGLRLSQYVALEGTWMSTFHDGSHEIPGSSNSILTGITGDAKIFLLSRPMRIEPFFQIGVGAYIWNRDGYGSEPLSGPGLQAGGGVDIHLNRAVSIGGTLLYRGAHLDNRNGYIGDYPEESTFLSVFSFGGNVQLHF